MTNKLTTAEFNVISGQSLITINKTLKLYRIRISAMLKSLDNLNFSRFCQIISKIKSPIFKMISNKFNSPKFDLDLDHDLKIRYR